MHWSKYPFIRLSSEESTPFFWIFTQFIHLSVYPEKNQTQKVANTWVIDALVKISVYLFIQWRKYTLFLNFFSIYPFIRLSSVKLHKSGSHLLSHCIIGQNIRLSIYPVKNTHLFIEFLLNFSIYPFIQRKIRHSR